MDQQFDDEINIREYLGVLIRKWKTIVLCAIVFAIIAWARVIRQEPFFEAKIIILMRNSGPSTFSQYAGVAGVMGITLPSGGSNGSDLLELLKSRAVALKVIDDLKLTQRIKGWDDPKINKSSLAASVSGMLKPIKTTGNVVELTVQANDAQLSADLANAFVSAMSFYWNELNYTEAKKKLRYIENELPRVENDLRSVENKLKLTPTSYTGGGIQRDYDLYNSIYTMLKKERENAKLESSKEIPPFSLVDPAEKPLSPSGPKVKLNVEIGLVLGLFTGVFLAFFQEYWEKSLAAERKK